ncbi:hypothetical protein Bind_2254 [Beijerinckia indica subsp. indica ATCC 9039]|uniref:Uncharacterized protein n=1 Tax=Beijerinckia indica subsp. indica (strain ATCC 9039 / DSM 1715 / NCIMB 8712) TaxID=395963 RepID=B2IH86_BEII9|nr:hypothetical protein Bind_2254 [Beijerinckia indica subsp. indica ATCC 9039]
MRQRVWKLVVWSVIIAGATPVLAQMEPGRTGNPKETIPEIDRSQPTTTPYMGVPLPQNPLREGRSSSPGGKHEPANGGSGSSKSMEPGMGNSAPVPYPNSTEEGDNVLFHKKWPQ